MIISARLARVEADDEQVQNISFTICRSTELIGPDSEKEEWMPFDPTRMKPLDERIRDAKKRARWKQRLKQR
jgi:hypothetical protein